MYRVPASLLLCCMALATGLALFGIGQALTIPMTFPSARSSAAADTNVALVERFYAATNIFLATGETEPLTETVTPDLVEYPRRLGGSSGRTGLILSLHSLRETYPNLALVVDELRPSGPDQVVARVHTEGAEDGTLLGLPFSANLALWEAREVFRIVDHHISERWSSHADALFFQSVARISDFGDGAAGRQLFLIQRMTYAPDAELGPRSLAGVSALIIQTGSLMVEVAASTESEHPSGRRPIARQLSPGDRAAAAPTTIEVGQPTLLVAGMVVSIPSGVSLVTRNEGMQPVTLLLVRMLPTANPRSSIGGAAVPPPSLNRTLTLTDGVEATTLAAIELDAIPVAATLAVGRVALASGETLELGQTPGPVILTLESGQLDLISQGEHAMVMRAASPDGRGQPMSTTRLAPGDGALLVPGSGSTLHASGDTPAVILVWTLIAIS